MPTYEFECNKCGHKFNLLESIKIQRFRADVRAALTTDAGVFGERCALPKMQAEGGLGDGRFARHGPAREWAAMQGLESWIHLEFVDWLTDEGPMIAGLAGALAADAEHAPGQWFAEMKSAG